MRRIVSFLPAATEMICRLGLLDRLVGVSHECDYPPEVRGKPIVVRPAINLKGLGLAEIDRVVSERIRSGSSLYQVDEKLLKDLAPDLIVTQDLCQVCAPSGNEVAQVLKSLHPTPEILWLTPKSLEEVFENIREVGRATGRVAEAQSLVKEGEARLGQVSRLTRGAKLRKVFCMEWIDPIYCAGHWMAELVDRAGGVDELAKRGADSVRIPWEEVLRSAPEVLILSPCGYNLPETVRQAPQFFNRPGVHDLPAVREGRVYAVDANAYFARPGPRLVEGAELLAHLIHPELVPWRGPAEAYRRL